MLRLSIPLLLTLCACADAGTAPDPSPTAAGPELAARPNPSFQPFSFIVTSCIEPVLVTGTFHEIDPRPGADGHIRFHINAKGVGVGQETGSRYQWNDRLFDNANLVRGTSAVLNDFTRLIGQGGAPNISVHVRAKLTVRPNGTVVVDRFSIKDTCQPS
jgi:hypothetical protein